MHPIGSSVNPWPGLQDFQSALQLLYPLRLLIVGLFEPGYFRLQLIPALL
jgi:hypothetical protein